MLLLFFSACGWTETIVFQRSIHISSSIESTTDTPINAFLPFDSLVVAKKVEQQWAGDFGFDTFHMKAITRS